MKITVTIRNSITHKDYDIMIDQKQKVRTTLEVLRENLPEVFEGMDDTMGVQSFKSKRWIDTASSYQELKVFNCDILILRNIGGEDHEKQDMNNLEHNEK